MFNAASPTKIIRGRNDNVTIPLPTIYLEPDLQTQICNSDWNIIDLWLIDFTISLNVQTMENIRSKSLALKNCQKSRCEGTHAWNQVVRKTGLRVLAA